MADLTRKVLAEKEYVTVALSNLKDVMAQKDKSIVELAAAATFLHNIYNGMENILKQVLNAKKVEIPRSRTKHKELLDVSVSEGVIPQGLCDELYEYLTFRHFFVHSYGFMLEESHLQTLAENIPNVWSQFIKAIEKYNQKTFYDTQ
jgi:uncharacterized protein YutE (UPF0331/DUF86 family)